MNTSSEKENKKVDADKAEKDNKVQEGKSNSILKEDGDKNKYPYKLEQDKQNKTQEEYLDRNNDSKDKS